MKSYKDEGVVLQRRNFGEADRIITVFSKSHGKVTLLAKGVRRLTSRKRGHVEVFSYIKFNVVQTHGMGILSEVETKAGFPKIRENLKKASLAFYLIEAIGRLSREEEENEKLFLLTLDALTSLEKTSRLTALKEKFVQRALETTGFWPAGKVLTNPDKALENVIERKMGSARVGKKILQ